MSKLWRLFTKIFRAITFSRKSAAAIGDPQDGQLLAFDCIQKERVREELNLSHEQSDQVGTHIREIRQKHRAEFSGLQTLPEHERRSARRKLRTLIAGEAMQAIYKAGILSDQQRTRFRQILWQQRGARAFTDPAVGEALQLEPPQKEAIATILKETWKKVGALSRIVQGSEDNRSDTEELRGEAMEQSLKLLTEKQRRLWDELKGAPFAVNLGPPTSSADDVE